MVTSPLRQRGKKRASIVTIRTMVGPGYLWSAICSGCPHWHIQRLPWPTFRRHVRVHRVWHARHGQVTA